MGFRQLVIPRIATAGTSFSPLPCQACHGYGDTSAHRVEVEVGAYWLASAPPSGAAAGAPPAGAPFILESARRRARVSAEARTRSKGARRTRERWKEGMIAS
jgi:hypothetical protein